MQYMPCIHGVYATGPMFKKSLQDQRMVQKKNTCARENLMSEPKAYIYFLRLVGASFYEVLKIVSLIIAKMLQAVTTSQHLSSTPLYLVTPSTSEDLKFVCYIVILYTSNRQTVFQRTVGYGTRPLNRLNPYYLLCWKRAYSSANGNRINIARYCPETFQYFALYYSSSRVNLKVLHTGCRLRRVHLGLAITRYSRAMHRPAFQCYTATLA